MTITEAARSHADERPDLSALLNPGRVAIVGASDRRETFSGGTIVNLVRHGFTGEIYPVNPRRETVGGMRAYPDVRSLPTDVDLAVVVVRADLVVDALRDSVQAGARAAIVVSSGFGEGAADEAGRRRAEQLTAFLAEYPIPILGPSTTGLVNLNDGFVPRAVTNHLPPERLKPGPIALISQSGAANNVVFNRAHAHGVPVGLAVATGIQANVTVWDVASAALTDPRIAVLAMLVEDLGSPDDYEPVLRRAAELAKPVVLLRTGRTEAGGRAIRTHTGALAGDWAVERQMLRSLGVMLVDDLDQLWEVAAIAHSWGQPPAGKKLGVIAFSGGEGALIADQAAQAGLQMADVSPEFEALVADKLELAGAGNPFDPTGEVITRPENGVAAIEGFVTTNDFDVTLVALNAQSAPTKRGLVDHVLGTLSRPDARVGITYWPIAGLSDGLSEALADFPGPALPGSHRMIAALRAWWDSRPPVGQPPQRAARRLDVPSGRPNYWQARKALSALGVPFAEAELVSDVDAAVRAAARVGYPAVLKANVVSTVHKAAAGLVRLGVSDEAALRGHTAELLAHAPAVVVEPTVVASASLIVGATHDERIGPVVLVGSGGGAAEYLQDTAVCPVRLLTPDTARDTIRRTAIGRFLEAREPACFEQLTELMMQLGPAVAGVSVDLNPVAVTTGGLIALDARIAEVGR